MKKGKLVNILILIFLGLLLFTPIGFHTKVLINRVISFNPSLVDEDRRQQLSSYKWILESREGIKLDFSELRGQVVLINYWATWCPPCVAEMPDLYELYNAYREEVVFLFIASDQKKKVDQFLEKHQYTIPVYYESGPSPYELETKSLPTTYVISRQGVIVVSEKGAANWNSDKITGLLDELIQE